MKQHLGCDLCMHRKKLPAHTGLGRHRNHQSCSLSTLSACPFKSVVRTLEVSYLALSAILLLRGGPVGVAYTGNNVLLKGEVFTPLTQMGVWMVQSQSNFDCDGARPVFLWCLYKLDLSIKIVVLPAHS